MNDMKTFRSTYQFYKITTLLGLTSGYNIANALKESRSNLVVMDLYSNGKLDHLIEQWIILFNYRIIPVDKGRSGLFYTFGCAISLLLIWHTQYAPNKVELFVFQGRRVCHARIQLPLQS